MHHRCDAAEKKPNLPCGVLKKEKQTAEDKQKELAEKIKQQQDKLEVLQVSYLFLVASLCCLAFPLHIFVSPPQKTTTIKSAADIKKLPMDVSMKPSAESSSKVNMPSLECLLYFNSHVLLNVTNINILLFLSQLVPLR